MSVNIQTSSGLVKIAGTPTIDTALSNVSKNPVQNKVVTEKFDEINNNLVQLEYGEVAGGKNLANINDFKQLTTNSNQYGYEWLNMKGGTYTFNITNGSNTLYIGYKHNGNIESISNVRDGSKVQTITIHDGDDILIWYGENVTTNYVTKIQLEYGSQATDYEPYIPSVKMLAEENAQQNTESMDLKMLGWTVPKEMPIKNYVDSDGVFHQRVGREDLGSSNWTYNKHFGTNAVVFHRVFSDAKGYGANVKPNIYCSKYTSAKVNTIATGMQDKSIAIWDNDNNIIISDTSYADAETFKNAMKGVYLYYELATEKTISVGSEPITELKNDLGGLSFSVSGTTLSITDGTNTWTLSN